MRGRGLRWAHGPRRVVGPRACRRRVVPAGSGGRCRCRRCTCRRPCQPLGCAVFWGPAGVGRPEARWCPSCTAVRVALVQAVGGLRRVRASPGRRDRSPAAGTRLLLGRRFHLRIPRSAPAAGRGRRPPPRPRWAAVRPGRRLRCGSTQPGRRSASRAVRPHTG